MKEKESKWGSNKGETKGELSFTKTAVKKPEAAGALSRLGLPAVTGAIFLGFPTKDKMQETSVLALRISVP